MKYELMVYKGPDTFIESKIDNIVFTERFQLFFSFDVSLKASMTRDDMVLLSASDISFSLLSFGESLLSSTMEIYAFIRSLPFRK